MAFEELSPNAEKLLQEIIEHRLPNGCCDSEHWKKRFENLSFDEDARIRSLFKELREQEMISVQWADNYPYFLVLLDKGYSYKDNKKHIRKKNENSVVVNIRMVEAQLPIAVAVFLFSDIPMMNARWRIL